MKTRLLTVLAIAIFALAVAGCHGTSKHHDNPNSAIPSGTHQSAQPLPTAADASAAPLNNDPSAPPEECEDIIPPSPNEPTPKEVNDFYKSTMPENIPTLAPAYRRWLHAFYHRDYATAWDAYDTRTRQNFVETFTRLIKMDKEDISKAEKQLDDPKLPADKRQQLQKYVEEMKKSIAEREACGDDGVKILACDTEAGCRRTNSNPISTILMYSPHWVKEVIANGCGVLDKKTTAGNHMVFFTLENGQWKINMSGNVFANSRMPGPEDPAKPKPTVADINNPTPKEVDDFYNSTKPENIPTFAPVYKKWFYAMYHKDYAAAWDCYNTRTHDAFVRNFKFAIEKDKKKLADIEKQFADPKTDQNQKQKLQAQIDEIKKNIAEREACGDDGLKLFTYNTETDCKKNGCNPITNIIKDNARWTTEIQIAYGLLDTKGANKQYFIKENGQWKVNASGDYMIMDENDYNALTFNAAPAP